MSQVENVEAKVGRRGFFRARGDLPIAQPDGGQHGLEPRGSQERWNAIVMDVHDLELRLRNMYTGAPQLHKLSSTQQARRCHGFVCTEQHEGTPRGQGGQGVHASIRTDVVVQEYPVQPISNGTVSA